MVVSGLSCSKLAVAIISYLGCGRRDCSQETELVAFDRLNTMHTIYRAPLDVGILGMVCCLVCCLVSVERTGRVK